MSSHDPNEVVESPLFISRTGLPSSVRRGPRWQWRRYGALVESTSTLVDEGSAAFLWWLAGQDPSAAAGLEHMLTRVGRRWFRCRSCSHAFTAKTPPVFTRIACPMCGEQDLMDEPGPTALG